MVHSSVVNHRRSPSLFRGAMLFIGSTTVHFTELVGKGFPSERTSFSSVYSDISGSKMHQSPLTVTSKICCGSLMRVCIMSLLLEPFRAALTGRIRGITLLSSSVFQDKAEVPTSVFHAVGTPRLILPMSHPQSSTALIAVQALTLHLACHQPPRAWLRSPAQHRARPPFHCQYHLFQMQNTLAVQCCQHENLEAKQIFLFRNATHSSPTSQGLPC